MAPPPGIAFYVIYMILSFGVGLLSFRFLIWFRARREAWKARQARGTIRVPSQYVPTGISAGTLNTAETPIKPLQMAVSITEHGDVVMGSPYIHRNSPLVTRQSIFSPRPDQLSGTNCSNLITSGGRTINISVTSVQAAHVRERSDYSETELSEIAPFLCDSTLNSQSTAHLVHDDGTGLVAPTPTHTHQAQTGPTPYHGSLRSPGTPRSVTHGEVSRPIFTNKRLVSEAVTLNGDAEELACYDAGPLPLYGFPRSPGTPRSVTHGDAIRPVFLSRRMVSEAVTLDGDAEELEQGYYEQMGIRGGGDDDTVVDEKEQVVVNEEAFDPSQFPPLEEWVVKVSKEMQEEEEKKDRWETAIEEAKEVVLSGWPTWQSYQRYLDWALRDGKARERMLDGWKECVAEAGRHLVQKHSREMGRKELVSVFDNEVEGNETTAPRGTVLEAALVMKESCAKLHKALGGMYVADSPHLRGMPVVVDRLEDTMIFLCYRWIGPRDIVLMDGIDNWVAETPKQEIAFKVLRKWKADGKGGDSFLWNTLERLLIQIKKPIGRHRWCLGEKRKFFGGTLETYTPDEKEEEAFCKAAGREGTAMRTWTAMSRPGARRNYKVFVSQKEAIDYYGIGDDLTEKVEPPTVTTPAAEPKVKPVTLTNAQATYIKNKAGLDAAEKAMAARDRMFPSSQPAPTPTFGHMIFKIVPCLKDMVNELSEGYSVYDGDVKSSIFKGSPVRVTERGVSIRGGLLDEEAVEEKKDEVEVLVDELADSYMSDVNDDKEEGQEDNSPSFSDYFQREKLHYALSFLDDTILERLPLFQIHGIRFALAELHDIEKILHSAVHREFKGGERLKRMLRVECEYFLLAGKLGLADEDEEECEEEEQGIFTVPNYSALNGFPWSGVHENEPESDSDSDATTDQAKLVPLPDSDSDSDLYDHTYGIPHPNPANPMCAPLNWFPWFKTHIVASSIIEAEKKFTRETEADARVAVKRLLDAASDARGRPSRAGHLKKHPDWWMWQCRDHEKACGECSMLSVPRLSSESMGRRERREMSLLRLHLVSRKNMGRVRTAMALNELEEAMEATAYEDCADPAIQAMWKDAAYLWLTGHLPVKTLMTDKDIDAGPCGPGRIIVRLRLMLINLEERGGIIAAFNLEHPNDAVDQEEVYQIKLEVTKVSIALLGFEAKMSMDELQERLLERCDLGGKNEETGEDSRVSQNLPRHNLRGGYLADEQEKYEVAVHIEDFDLFTASAPAHFHDSSSDCDSSESASSSASPWSAESVNGVHSEHTTSAAPPGINTRIPFTSFQKPDGTWKAIRDPARNPDGTWMASADVPNAIPWKERMHWQELQLNVGHLWDVEDFFRHETMWRQFLIDTEKGNFRALERSQTPCVDVKSTFEDDDEDGKSRGITSQSSYDAWDPLPYPKQSVKLRVYPYASAERVENQVSFSSTWAKHIEVLKFDDEDWKMDGESLRSLLDLTLFFQGLEGALLAIAHGDSLQEIETLTPVNEGLTGHHDPIADAVALLSTPRTGSLRTTRIANRKAGKLCRRFTPYPMMRCCPATRPLSPIPKETLQPEYFDPFRLAYRHPSIRNTISTPFTSGRAGGVEFSSITNSKSQSGTDVAWAAFQFIYDLEEPVDRFAFNYSARDPEKAMLPNDLMYGKRLTRLSSAYCKGVEKRSEEKRKGSTRVNWVRENPKLWLAEKWIFPGEWGVCSRRDRALKFMGMRVWWDKDSRCRWPSQKVDRKDEVMRQRIGQRNGTIRPFLQKRVMGRSKCSRGQRRVRDVRKEDPRADIAAESFRDGDLPDEEDIDDAVGRSGCRFCSQEFSHFQSLALHMPSHAGIRTFRCQEPDCGCRASQASQRTIHMRRKHTTEMPVASDDPHACHWQDTQNFLACGLRCPFTAALQSYVQITHAAPLSKSNGIFCLWVECHNLSLPSANFRLVRRSKLDRHVQIHTGHNVYGCPLCHGEFSTSQMLGSHMRTYLADKPFKCREPMCGYETAQASELTMRTRTRHTREEPLVCDETGCGRRVAESSNLAKQRKIHEREEEWRCAVCGKGFKRRGQLSRHQRIHLRMDSCGADIDDMAQPAPLSSSDQRRQMPRLTPALLSAIQASHQRALTTMRLDGRTQVQHTERCRPNLCAPGCTANSTLREDDERPRGGALSVNAHALPWGRHTVCCRAGYCVIGCRSVLTLPHETSEFKVDNAVMETFKGVRQTFPSRLFLPHPIHVLSTTSWCQGLADRPVRLPDWEPALPKHSVGLRDGDLAVKIKATTLINEDGRRPSGGALDEEAEGLKKETILAPWGRHAERCEAQCCVVGCKSLLTLPYDRAAFVVDINEHSTSLPDGRTSLSSVPLPGRDSATKSQTEVVAPRWIPIPHSLMREESEESVLSKLSELSEDSTVLRGGALGEEAEAGWAEASRRETELAPWGRHAERCTENCCTDGCKSILTLPHDRSAFGFDTARLATSLPDERILLPSAHHPRQVSAPTSPTQVVAPTPIHIPHSLILEKGEGSELNDLSEESERLRGGGLDEGGEGDGPWRGRTELCRTGYCAIRCTSIFSLMHEEDGLEVDKASTEVLVTVTETDDEPPPTALGHRWDVHREGCRPGYCVRGRTAITNLLGAHGDDSQEDRDSVGQWKYLFGRDVVPSLNLFASIRNEMFDEEESGGVLMLSSSAPPVPPTQVSMEVTPSKDSITGRKLEYGGMFAFKGDYARKESEFETPSDQLPTWRLGPWIGHDVACRRVRCALGCGATITLESEASWSIGKRLAHEMWAVDPPTNAHDDGVLAKAFMDAQVPIVPEEAVASEENPTDSVFQAFAAAFSASVQPSDIMLKQPLVMEEVSPNPSSEGRLRGGLLQCTKKKAGWLIDERLRSSFPPPNITQRHEPELPNSPPLTPPLSAPQNQINTAIKLSAFIPLLPPSPPHPRNNYITKIGASKPFNPYEVWPHDAPFLPPLKGYWSPEYDKSGFWRRPVCPGELHKRLSFLPDTGKFRWCDDRTIERVEIVQEGEEFAKMGLRGGGMNEEDFEWIEDFESSADTVDDESQYETLHSPPQSPPDEECDMKCRYPLTAPLRDLWPGWVTEEEKTPVSKSPPKRSFDEMMGLMDLHDEKHTAAITQHHQYGLSLQGDAVDIHYPEIAESSTRVHIADLDNSWDIVHQDDDRDPPSTLSLRHTHQTIAPIYSPDMSASSDSTLSDEDTENRSIYCAAPRRLTQLIVGECKQFSRTLMHHGTGLLMMHRDWCAGTPSSMRYMQDAYSWRQHLKEARIWEERLREKVRRRGIELARQAEDVKDEKVELGLRQIVELRTRNEEDRGLMSFKPFERPEPPAEREKIKTGDPRLSKLENVTRLVRQHFKQRCQWRFSWEQWNEVEDIVQRDMEGDEYMPDSEAQDGEGGCVIFEREEEDSIRGGHGLLGKRKEKSGRCQGRARHKKRSERKMMHRYAALWKERKKAWKMDFS